MLPAHHYAYQMITEGWQLQNLLEELQGDVAALDFETTALHPSAGRVRLAQIANDSGCWVIDFDQLGGFDEWQEEFCSDIQWIAFYAKFEASWFAGNPMICDVQNMRKAKIGGGHLSLKLMIEWDLDFEISKEEQASDWSLTELTPEQLQYAADDAVHTWQLYCHWDDELDEDHLNCTELLDDLLLPVMEMERTGFLLDQAHHKGLVNDWNAQREAFTKRIRHYCPTEPENLRSRQQWGDVFAQVFPDEVLDRWPRAEKTEQLQVTQTSLAMISALPGYANTEISDLLLTLARYNKIEKYIGSFGENLLTMARTSGDGRIRPSFNIGAARTLRFSSSGPNIQQLPRDILLFPDDDHITQVRRSVIAPPGKKLISFDYSSIEVRVLALLSGDENLLDDAVYGDVHTAVAEVIAGGPIDKNTQAGKAARSKAKGVTFGIIYGSAAPGLAISMGTDPATAGKYIDFWANRYPKAFDYRNVISNEARETGFASMVDGGQIYMTKRPEMPRCANYPVQRGAWTVMAHALIRHYDDLGELPLHYPDEALMVATVHDQIIDEARAADAVEVAHCMARSMTQGYLDAFPGAPTDRLLEGGIGDNWADLEEIEL